MLQCGKSIWVPRHGFLWIFPNPTGAVLRRNPAAVTIKGPWPDRDRERNADRDRDLEKSDAKRTADEAPVGPGPPMSSFKPRRFP